MHWNGIIIAFVSGLLGNNIVRDAIRKHAPLAVRRYVPSIDDYRFDKIMLVLLVLGLGIAVYENKSLSNQIDLLEYQDVSSYNVFGNKSGAVGGVHMVATPINDWNERFVSRQNHKFICECNSLAIKSCKLVIEKMPAYPFAYYFLALCQKENEDQSWRQSAKKAKSIFEKTTRISSHHSDHDLILDEVTKLLRN